MIFVATTCIFVVWKVYTLYIKISLANPALFQAAFLVEEGIEAMKFIRADNWTSYIAPLNLDVPYTLIFDGVRWGVTTTPIFIDNKFDRRVTLSEVYRDSNGDIAVSGTLDPKTKKLVSSVSWQKDAATTTRQITTYINNVFNN